MLFGSGTSLGLEPMREMGRTTIHGPDTDRMGNSIGSGTVKGLATTHLLEERGIGGLGEGLGDLLEVEDVLAKELGCVDGGSVGMLGVGDLAGGAVDVVAEGLNTGCVQGHFFVMCFCMKLGRGCSWWLLVAGRLEVLYRVVAAKENEAEKNRSIQRERERERAREREESGGRGIKVKG